MKVTLDMIDPELREIAEALMDSPIRDDDAFREGMLAGKELLPFDTPKNMRCDEVWISRKNSEKKIRLAIFKPLAGENLPGILWMHGGAFATGAPEACVAVFQRLMDKSPCVIVSPDYQLSLKAPYPAGLDDCYAALLWMKENAAGLGIREDQLAVGGDSSGASLAVSLTMMARDSKDVNIAFQMPLFPALDDRMKTDSIKDNNAPLADGKLIYFAWKYYLGDLFETDNVPVYAAPLRTVDYSRLPPFISYVGGLDPLRDDDVLYAENLKKAGTPIHFKVFEGGFHGFEEFCPEAAISKRAKSFFLNAYKYAVENYFAPQNRGAL